MGLWSYYHPGGKVKVTGVGMYTPAGSPLIHFAACWSNTTVDVLGFNDLSGNVSGSLYGPGQ
jgi:hypothetical protein